MSRKLVTLLNPRHLWWQVAAVAALVLVVRVGSYGFVEPQEVQLLERADAFSEAKQTLAASDAADRATGAEGQDQIADDGESADDSETADDSEAEADRSDNATARTAAQRNGAREAKRAERERRKAQEAADAPLHTKIIAWGVATIGSSELGARLPFAVLALLTVMASFLLGLRLQSARAGAIAALVLLSSPLLVLQARLLTSEIATTLGATLVVLGLTGFAARRKAGGRAGVRIAVVVADCAAIALGAVLATSGRGLGLGLVPPVLGFGLGALFYSAAASTGPTPAQGTTRWWLDPARQIGALLAVVGVLAAAFVLWDAFTLRPTTLSERGVFGYTLEADRDPLMGFDRPWLSSEEPKLPFSALFEQLAFGLFPWIGLVPFAVGALALGSGLRPRRSGDTGSAGPAPFAGGALFAWAGLAWLLATLAARHVEMVIYPAVPAIALMIGLWLDGLLATRARASEQGDTEQGDTDDTGQTPLARSLPLVALFLLLAGLAITRNLSSDPKLLLSLVSLDGAIKYPEDSKLHLVVALVGLSVAVGGAIGLYFYRSPYRSRRAKIQRTLDLLGRYGVHAALAIALLFGLILSQLYVPAIASRLSSRDLLSKFHDVRQEGEPLALVGNLGAGVKLYADDDHVELKGRKELVEFLERPSRVFALTRSQDLCPLHKDLAKRETAFHVIDNSNVQYMLLSNRLGEGEVDHNPLTDVVRRTPPANLGKPLSITFENQLELIGADFPAAIDRGDTFTMTLVYKVLAPISRPWKIFIHIDGPTRIGADHDPAGGHCKLNQFQTGDYIIDRHTIKAGDITSARGTYQVWSGLFVGSGGNFTNMKVSKGGQPDRDHRIKLGTIQIK